MRIAFFPLFNVFSTILFTPIFAHTPQHHLSKDSQGISLPNKFILPNAKDLSSLSVFKHLFLTQVCTSCNDSENEIHLHNEEQSAILFIKYVILYMKRLRGLLTYEIVVYVLNTLNSMEPTGGEEMLWRVLKSIGPVGFQEYAKLLNTIVLLHPSLSDINLTQFSSCFWIQFFHRVPIPTLSINVLLQIAQHVVTHHSNSSCTNEFWLPLKKHIFGSLPTWSGKTDIIKLYNAYKAKRLRVNDYTLRNRIPFFMSSGMVKPSAHFEQKFSRPLQREVVPKEYSDQGMCFLVMEKWETTELITITDKYLVMESDSDIHSMNTLPNSSPDDQPLYSITERDNRSNATSIPCTISILNSNRDDQQDESYSNSPSPSHNCYLVAERSQSAMSPSVPCSFSLLSNSGTDPLDLFASNAFARPLQCHLIADDFKLSELPLLSNEDSAISVNEHEKKSLPNSPVALVELKRLERRSKFSTTSSIVCKARVMESFDDELLSRVSRELAPTYLMEGDISRSDAAYATIIPRDAEARQRQLARTLKVRMNQCSVLKIEGDYNSFISQATKKQASKEYCDILLSCSTLSPNNTLWDSLHKFKVPLGSAYKVMCEQKQTPLQIEEHFHNHYLKALNTQNNHHLASLPFISEADIIALTNTNMMGIFLLHCIQYKSKALIKELFSAGLSVHDFLLLDTFHFFLLDADKTMLLFLLEILLHKNLEAVYAKHLWKQVFRVIEGFSAEDKDCFFSTLFSLHGVWKSDESQDKESVMVHLINKLSPDLDSIDVRKLLTYM